MKHMTRKIAEVLNFLNTACTQKTIAEHLGTNQVRLSKIKNGLLKGNPEVLVGLRGFIHDTITEFKALEQGIDEILLKSKKPEMKEEINTETQVVNFVGSRLFIAESRRVFLDLKEIGGESILTIECSYKNLSSRSVFLLGCGGVILAGEDAGDNTISQTTYIDGELRVNTFNSKAVYNYTWQVLSDKERYILKELDELEYNVVEAYNDNEICIEGNETTSDEAFSFWTTMGILSGEHISPFKSAVEQLTSTERYQDLPETNKVETLRGLAATHSNRDDV